MAENMADLQTSSLDKEDWINTYGSHELLIAFTQGYECHQEYLSQRLKMEFPRFNIVLKNRYKRVDMPSSVELKACYKWENSFVVDSYLGRRVVIPNWLGEYDLVSKATILDGNNFLIKKLTDRNTIVLTNVVLPFALVISIPMICILQFQIQELHQIQKFFDRGGTCSIIRQNR